MTEWPVGEGFSFWDRSIDSDKVGELGSNDRMATFTNTRRLRRSLPAEPPEPRSESVVFSVFDREDVDSEPPVSRSESVVFSVFDREDSDTEQTGPFPLPIGDTLPPPEAAPTGRVNSSTSFGRPSVGQAGNAEPGANALGGSSRFRAGRREPKKSVLASWFDTFDQPPPLAVAAMVGSFAVVFAVVGFWLFTTPGEEVTVAGRAEAVIDGSSEAEPPLSPELVEDAGEDPNEDLVEPSSETAPVVEDTEPESTTAAQAEENVGGESEATRGEREKVAESTSKTAKPRPSATAAKVAKPPESTTTTVPETTTTTVEPTTTTAPTTTTTDPNADEDSETAID